MTGIYKITNLIDGKVYIGQGLDIFHRWSKHSQIPSNSLLHQAIKQDGIENFSFQIIELCEKDQLDEKEKYWIAHFNSYIKSENSNGYNMNEGGWENYTSSKAIPIEQYDLQGNFIAEYPSTTIASQQTGIELRSIQHCCGGSRQAKTAGGFQWKRKDDNKKISSINKRINFEVLQIDKKTNQIVQKFKSPAEASKITGISNVGITNCCNNKQKTSGNFIWKYVEEKEIICNKKDKEN